GAILIYNITNPESYLNTTKWAKEMVSISNKRPVILVGNKIDLRTGQSNYLTTDDDLRKANRLSIMLGTHVPSIETAAKNNVNIDIVFTELGRAIIKDALNRIVKKRI
ncbi:MAG: hypothetical protein Q6363_005075, partial [Candidatus Njordarchaeota archaeon]